jgi:hypothetical protein
MTAQRRAGCLKKNNPCARKGVGRGLHRSDIISSTVGYIADAGVQIEYGKNYDGYWDGMMFMNQVCFLFDLYFAH